VGQSCCIGECDEDDCRCVMHEHFVKIVLGLLEEVSNCVFEMVSETYDIIESDSPVVLSHWKLNKELLNLPSPSDEWRMGWDSLKSIEKPKSRNH